MRPYFISLRISIAARMRGSLLAPRRMTPVLEALNCALWLATAASAAAPAPSVFSRRVTAFKNNQQSATTLPNGVLQAHHLNL